MARPKEITAVLRPFLQSGYSTERHGRSEMLVAPDGKQVCGVPQNVRYKDKLSTFRNTLKQERRRGISLGIYDPTVPTEPNGNGDGHAPPAAVEVEVEERVGEVPPDPSKPLKCRYGCEGPKAWFAKEMNRGRHETAQHGRPSKASTTKRPSGYESRSQSGPVRKRQVEPESDTHKVKLAANRLRLHLEEAAVDAQYIADTFESVVKERDEAVTWRRDIEKKLEHIIDKL